MLALDPERWHLIDSLLQQLWSVPPSDRDSHLRAVCQGDRDLETELRQLLSREDHAFSALDQPAGWARPKDEAVSRSRQLEGLRIGPYRLGELIGEGGMSVVYAAEQETDQIHRSVAIKLLKGGLWPVEAEQRFQAEARILANLEHPLIARIYDAGTLEKGTPYLVLEHVKGQPIDHYCEAAAPSLQELLDLFQQICQAVAYAHANLVIHRDLKPSNVLVDQEGRVRLLDFGIAKFFSPDDIGTGETATALHPMTPQYASPEQLRGLRVSTSTDVYSLGLLLYRLLSGHLPYRASSNSHEDIKRLLADIEKIPPLRAASQASPYQTTVPEDLETIVLKALEVEPQRRYPSIEQLAEDLERFRLGRPVLARRQTLGYRAGLFVKRHRLASGLVAVLVLSLLTFTTVLSMLAVRLDRERRIALEERNSAQQVADYMADVFRLSSPFEARGSDVTARKLLEGGADRIRHLSDQPRVQARFRQAIGRAYLDLGMLEEARPILRQNLEIRRNLEVRPRELAESLATMSTLEYEAAKDFPAAERFALEALQVLQSQADVPLDLMANTMSLLGGIRARLGRWPEALATQEQAQDLFRQSGSEDFELRTEILLRIATAQKMLDGPSAAAETLRIALRDADAQLGPDHALSMRGLLQKSVVAQALGELEKAHEILEELKTRQQRVLGEEHPDLAFTFARQAGLRLRQGHLQDAEQIARRALQLRREALGDSHLSVAPSLSMLSAILAQQGRLEAAASLAEESLAIAQMNLPPMAPQLANPLSTVGHMKLRLGQVQQAENYLRQALRVLEQSLPEGNGRLEEARKAHESALAALASTQPTTLGGAS